MKKLLIILGIAASSFTYANEPVSRKVMDAFATDFAKVNAVQWQSLEASGLYQATFLYNGEELNAFYNEEGEMVGTSRYIKKSQLPLMIQKEIAAKYDAHFITTIIERNLNGATTYFVTIDSNKNALMLQANATGELSVYKKIKKRG